MIVFLDTEYAGVAFPDELISMGLVSEDGSHEIYVEVSDFDRERCSAWVQAHVWPHLGGYPDSVCTRDQVPHVLRAWFATLPRVVRIANDSLNDWRHLARVFASDWPRNVAIDTQHTPYVDLAPMIDDPIYHHAVCRYHEAPGRPWHHALHDARAHRAGWLAWMDAQKGRGR